MHPHDESTPSSLPPHLPPPPPVGSSSRESRAHPLRPGDVVEVCEGDLMHLQGKVISVEGETVTIIPKHEDLKVGSIWR